MKHNSDRDIAKGFIDRAKVVIRAGDGGDGCSSFRREKYVPKGGPDGGDGGKGGDVYFRANSHLKTLLDFVRRPHHQADRGGHGKGKKQSGPKGEDLILDVPCGTVIQDDENVLADLLFPGDQVLVAKGGQGGRGNIHFKSSIRQAPRISERGEPGEAKELNLQLKVIADVGLVGMPNAGKSTLLSRLTRANPKIANYPFTTLSPNLGVALYDDREIVFADIPGLIEGSHTGKGLGHEFLQHVERTRILVHIVDPLGFSGKEPKENIKIIQSELKKYSPALAKKPEVLVINKQDLTDADKVFKLVKKSNRRKPVLAMSGVSGQGVPELLGEVVQILDELPEEKPRSKEKNLHISLEPDFWVEQNKNKFLIKGKKVEKLILMTNFDLPEAVKRTHHILKKMGVERALLARGAKEGDPVKVANMEFSFAPEPIGNYNQQKTPPRRRRPFKR